MNESIVTQVIEQKQPPATTDGLHWYKGEQIFCPMCEDWHENSTWCQYPGWEG